MTIYVLLNRWSARAVHRVQSEGFFFFSEWQGNFSIDLYCDYKIIRQVLNLSLKASLKSVIAKLDTFGAVKKRASRHPLLLLSRGIRRRHCDIHQVL